MIKEALIDMIQKGPLDPEVLLHVGVFACEITDHFIHTKANCPADIECGPECSYCCETVLPDITIPEVIYFNQYVKENDIEPNEYKKGRCPFLNDIGSCSVHPARPVRCRGWNSRDLDFCKNPPYEFDIKNCAVWYPQFQVGRKVQEKLISALQTCGYGYPVLKIDEVFKDKIGVSTAMFTEGLITALAAL